MLHLSGKNYREVKPSPHENNRVPRWFGSPLANCLSVSVSDPKQQSVGEIYEVRWMGLV